MSELRDRNNVDNAEALKHVKKLSNDVDPINNRAKRLYGELKTEPWESKGKLCIEIASPNLKEIVTAEEDVNAKKWFDKGTKVEFTLDETDKEGKKVGTLWWRKNELPQGLTVLEPIPKWLALASMTEPFDNVEALKMTENELGELHPLGKACRRFAGVVKEDPKDFMFRPQVKKPAPTVNCTSRLSRQVSNAQ